MQGADDMSQQFKYIGKPLFEQWSVYFDITCLGRAGCERWPGWSGHFFWAICHSCFGIALKVSRLVFADSMNES